jgi:hypothetical protein
MTFASHIGITSGILMNQSINRRRFWSGTMECVGKLVASLTGLAPSVYSSRHFGAGLSHTAPSGLGSGDSVPALFPRGGSERRFRGAVLTRTLIARSMLPSQL